METLLSDRTLFSSELLNENKDVGSILILGLGKNKNPKTEREGLPRASINPVFWRIPTGAFDGIICELNERYSEQQSMAVSPISGAHESRHQRDTASGHSLKFSITALHETRTRSQPHKRAPFHLVQAVATFIPFFRPVAPRVPTSILMFTLK